MNPIRHWISLCESVPSDDQTIQKAANLLLDNIDWSGGDGENILSMINYEEGEDTQSPEFIARLHRWAEEKVHDALSEIEYQFYKGGNSDSIRVYRMITAPPNWKPDPNRHPGEFWSWDRHAADAHWGSFSRGHVKWMMEAKVTADQINWITTLAWNATPSLEHEKEITIPESVPITVRKYWRVK